MKSHNLKNKTKNIYNNLILFHGFQITIDTITSLKIILITLINMMTQVIFLNLTINIWIAKSS